ncbi:MAG: 1-phosphofructokinase family hexose kinase [Candidatus Xenobium sp.]|jgi:1-phosphofructokinase family hexose kinase|nr:hexose kinase [Burkholderiales bacterium]
MLLIVASNPAIDRTLHVPLLEPGRVHRPREVHLGAGGKGLNVARVIRILDHPYRLTGCLAGNTGNLVAELAREEGLETDWHRLPRGETRNCMLFNHDQGDATVINEPGPVLDAGDWDDFVRKVEEMAGAARGVLLAGSVPPSIDPEAYAGLCRSLARRVGRVWVDSPGPPLAAILRDPRGLSLKVNQAEFSEALGRPLDDPGRLLAALRSVLGAGAALVGITQGPQGALLATADGAWRVEAPPTQLVSSVGSGDSFLAGMAVAWDRQWGVPDSLRLAAACGAANAESPYPGRFRTERVQDFFQKCRAEYLG